MEVFYHSTRSGEAQVKASQAILKGLSEDGGLFVPDHIPALDKDIKQLAEMDYRQVAYEVMKLYLTDFTEEELKGCIDRAYDSKFDTEEIVPMAEAAGLPGRAAGYPRFRSAGTGRPLPGSHGPAGKIPDRPEPVLLRGTDRPGNRGTARRGYFYRHHPSLPGPGKAEKQTGGGVAG